MIRLIVWVWWVTCYWTPYHARRRWDMRTAILNWEYGEYESRMHGIGTYPGTPEEETARQLRDMVYEELHWSNLHSESMRMFLVEQMNTRRWARWQRRNIRVARGRIHA